MNRGSRLDDWFPNNLGLDDFQVVEDAVRTWDLASPGLAGFLPEAQSVSRCAVRSGAIRPQSRELAVSASATGSLHCTGWFPEMLFVLNLINTVVNCMDYLCWRERKKGIYL